MYILSLCSPDFRFSGAEPLQKKYRQGHRVLKTDVFTEPGDGEVIPAGFAELTIKASIKTHLEGHYVLESRESLHGKEKYPFLVRIDGQAARWEVVGVRDVKPAYDCGREDELRP